jgi:hypothetical protein
MTAATFKKIAQPKTIAKSEIHIVLPHILAALITELYSRSGDFAGCLAICVTPIFNGDFGRNLLSELRKLLGLRGHHLELHARMFGR